MVHVAGCQRAFPGVYAAGDNRRRPDPRSAAASPLRAVAPRHAVLFAVPARRLLCGMRRADSLGVGTPPFAHGLRQRRVLPRLLRVTPPPSTGNLRGHLRPSQVPPTTPCPGVQHGHPRPPLPSPPSTSSSTTTTSPASSSSSPTTSTPTTADDISTFYPPADWRRNCRN